ncbi:MAG: hypothetical protein M3Z20_14380 [Chloroflexota bacterium]|nr:hypothetical protein [Chloroflexota bacterium]
MDHATFDNLARELATTSTRRARLGLALGAAGGALASLFLTDDPGAEGKGKKQNKGHRGKKEHKRKKKKKQPQPDQPCPGTMTDCGEGVCVPDGECCPWEKPCGEGCLNAQSCCPHTERTCPNGKCVATGACCPDTERTCPNGGCVAKDACCPIIEEVCGDECCDFSELCSDDGCCPVDGTSDVCDGKCTSLDSNEHCGACGNACGTCKTCKKVNGNFVCAGPDRSAPACEDCLEGEVVSATSCGDHCCGIGAECCGGGCCASGKCRVSNGQTCCLRVIDNVQICLVM